MPSRAGRCTPGRGPERGTGPAPGPDSSAASGQGGPAWPQEAAASAPPPRVRQDSRSSIAPFHIPFYAPSAGGVRQIALLLRRGPRLRARRRRRQPLLLRLPPPLEQAPVVLDAITDAVEASLDGRSHHHSQDAEVLQQAVLLFQNVGSRAGRALHQPARGAGGAALHDEDADGGEDGQAGG